ncbi:hypothetical protein [Sulfuricaulis sp.]|uniref:hypothetical protein n=1 Tax=Sulfuricaulis sp. TaxID=2003553 RepID=UPI0035595CB9
MNQIHAEKLKSILRLLKSMSGIQRARITNASKCQKAFVMDENSCVLGALNMHDLFRAGVI